MTNASLPTITTATAAPKDVDALVIGVAEASGGPVLVGAGDELEKAWAKRHAGSRLSAAQQVGASTKVGATVTLPGSPLVVVTGLGGVDVTPEQVRRAARERCDYGPQGKRYLRGGHRWCGVLVYCGDQYQCCGELRY